MCKTHIILTEQRNAIPSHLLGAISLVESGHRNEEEQRKTASPWAVNVNGKGKFHNTEALATVKALRAANTRYIDVGCMQANWNQAWRAERLRAGHGPAQARLGRAPSQGPRKLNFMTKTS